jgi:bifunctional DNA-binding transcriptional regulator/antitoxin component of YhaV-PrlF toxin-antitoxin module
MNKFKNIPSLMEECFLRGLSFVKKNESFKEYRMVDNMGRIDIPLQFLKHANIKPFSTVQFYSYKGCIVMEQIQSTPFHLQEKTTSVNFIRTIDSLNRVVIPKNLREIHNISIHENIEINIINKCVIFNKITKGNTSVEIIKSSMESELVGCSNFKVKGGKITLTDLTLKLLDLETNTSLQFFIKDEETIVAKTHQYTFDAEESLFFTGQSRIVNKYKYLTIPKKLRDYLQIQDGDNLKVKTVKNTLVIRKIN